MVVERLAGKQNFNTSKQGLAHTNLFNSSSFDGDLLAGTVYQKDAPDDLKVVSWPKNKGVEDVDDLEYYAYERTSAQRSVIYVVEEGIDPANTVGLSASYSSI